MDTGEETTRLKQDYKSEAPTKQIAVTLSGKEYIEAIMKEIEQANYGDDVNKGIKDILFSTAATDVASHQKATANKIKDEYGDQVGEEYLSLSVKMVNKMVDEYRRRASGKEDFSQQYYDDLCIEEFNRSRGFETETNIEFSEVKNISTPRQRPQPSLIPQEFQERVSNLSASLANQLEEQKQIGIQARLATDDLYIQQFNKQRGF